MLSTFDEARLDGWGRCSREISMDASNKAFNLELGSAHDDTFLRSPDTESEGDQPCWSRVSGTGRLRNFFMQYQIHYMSMLHFNWNMTFVCVCLCVYVHLP